MITDRRDPASALGGGAAVVAVQAGAFCETVHVLYMYMALHRLSVRWLYINHSFLRGAMELASY